MGRKYIKRGDLICVKFLNSALKHLTHNFSIQVFLLQRAWYDGDLIHSLSLKLDFQITNHTHVYESKLPVVKDGVHIYTIQAQYLKVSFKLSLMICKAVVVKLAEKTLKLFIQKNYSRLKILYWMSIKWHHLQRFVKYQTHTQVRQ